MTKTVKDGNDKHSNSEFHVLPVSLMDNTILITSHYINKNKNNIKKRSKIDIYIIKPMKK